MERDSDVNMPWAPFFELELDIFTSTCDQYLEIGQRCAHSWPNQLAVCNMLGHVILPRTTSHDEALNHHNITPEM